MTKIDLYERSFVPQSIGRGQLIVKQHRFDRSSNDLGDPKTARGRRRSALSELSLILLLLSLSLLYVRIKSRRKRERGTQLVLKPGETGSHRVANREVRSFASRALCATLFPLSETHTRASTYLDARDQRRVYHTSRAVFRLLEAATLPLRARRLSFGHHRRLKSYRMRESIVAPKNSFQKKFVFFLRATFCQLSRGKFLLKFVFYFGIFHTKSELKSKFFTKFLC